MSYGVFRHYPYRYPRPVFIPTKTPSGNIYTGTFSLGKTLAVTTTALIPWNYEQLFNSLSDGDLNGQDSWTKVSGLLSVGNYSPYDGEKDLQTVAPTSPSQSYYRNVTGYDYGVFYFAVKGGQATGSAAYISIGNTANDPLQHAQVRFDDNGKIYVYDWGSDWVEISSWSADTWYVIGIDFNCTTDTYKINIDNGAWSSNYDMLNSGNVNRISLTFYGGTSVSNTWLFDTISLSYRNPPYANSLELDNSLSLSNSAGLSVIGTISLGKTLGINTSAGLLFVGTIALGKILSFSDTSQLTAIGNVGLGGIYGLSDTSQLSGTSQLSLLKSLVLSETSQLSGVGNLTLPIFLDLDTSAGLYVAGTLSLDKVLGLTDSGLLIAVGNVGLGGLFGLSDNSQLSGTSQLNLANLLSFSDTSNIIGVNSITLPKIIDINLSGVLLLLGSLELGKIVALTTSGTIVTVATVYQYSFRWRNDDGDEDEATWRQNENVDALVDKATTIRLRVLLDTSGDLDPSSFQLEYRKVGDTDWEIVQL